MENEQSAAATGNEPVGQPAEVAADNAVVQAPEQGQTQSNGDQYVPSQDANNGDDGQEGDQYLPSDNANKQEDGVDKADVDPEKPDAVEGLPASPDGYTFNEPEGFTANQDRMGAFRETLHESGVKSEQAQKLFDLYVEDRKAMTSEVMGAFLKELDAKKAAVDAEHGKRCISDPEFGGANIKQSGTYIAKAIRTLLPNQEERAEFDTFFREAGLKNNYPVFKLLASAGKILAEGKTNTSSGSIKNEKTAAEILYPEFKSEVANR